MRRSSTSVHSVLLTPHPALLGSGGCRAAREIARHRVPVRADRRDAPRPFPGWLPCRVPQAARARCRPLDRDGAVALMLGVIVLSSDLDLTFPLPLGDGAVLTPRVGGSVIVGGIVGGGEDAGGFGGTLGYNIGIGLVGPIGPRTALRFDFTHRRFDAPISSATIGFVWTP